MVSLKEVGSANTNLSTTLSKQSLNAVFVGATRGIGKATLQSFARHISHPKAFIIGRNAQAFAPELERLRTINPNGTFVFLEAEIELLRDIDAVCKQATAKLTDGEKIDLLFLSQGYISFRGREENADGLDRSASLRYYGRMRFVARLLPHLNEQGGRVISVLAGGKEGRVFEDDMDLQTHYGVANAADHFASLTTLSFDRLAKRNPGMGFLHVFPGLVRTGLLGRSATGWLGVGMRWVLEPVLGGLGVARDVDDAGERMLWAATEEGFGRGSWSLDWDGRGKETEALRGYRDRGLEEKVVEHVHNVFERVVDA